MPSVPKPSDQYEKPQTSSDFTKTPVFPGPLRDLPPALYPKREVDPTPFSLAQPPTKRPDPLPQPAPDPKRLECPHPECKFGSSDDHNQESRVRSHLNDKHRGWEPPTEWLLEHRSVICPNGECKRVKSLDGYCRSCSFRDPNTGAEPVEAIKATRLPGIKTNDREVVSLGGSRKEWDEGLRPAKRSEAKACTVEPECKQPETATRRLDACIDASNLVDGKRVRRAKTR